MMKVFIKFVLSVLFLGIWQLKAQQTTLPVENYATKNYNAANQNWGVSINKNGFPFFANHQGLLTFNGQNWHLLTLPNKTIVRSVLCDNDKVYTGSYEEFGFWKADENGTYNYSSLTSLIDKSHTFESEEFWQILKWNNTIVFRSFTTIYIYNGKTIQVINPGKIITDLTVYRNQLIIGTAISGVYRLTKNNELALLSGFKNWQQKAVADMVVEDDNLIIGTRFNGVFKWNGEELLPYNTKVNNFVKEYQLNKITKIGVHKLAFGTIKNGLLLFDETTQTSSIINRELKLQNNTILGLAADDDNLWVALDNGIDRVKINSSITYYSDDSGELGTVYDVAFFNNTVYLGSNTGVYYFKNNELKFLEGSQGHVWDLAILGNRLICGHNNGTYDISDNSFKEISNFSGGYYTVHIPGTKNSYIQGNYIGIAVLKNNNGKWSATKIDGIDFPVNNIKFSNNHSIWVTHPYKGFFKIDLNWNYTKGIVDESIKEPITFNDYQTALDVIDNKIAFYNSSNWYTYANGTKEIIPFTELKDYENNKLLLNDKSNGYWFLNENDNQIFYTKLNKKPVVIDDKELLGSLTPSFEKIIQKNDSIYYFTLNDGFARFNLKAYQRRKNKLSANNTIIFKTFKTKENLYNASLNNLEIPFKQSASIQIEVIQHHTFNGDYSYMLEGPIQQQASLNKGALLLQNLIPGNYTLKVFSKENKEVSKTLDFEILPPWYLSTLMYVIYMCGFFIALYIFYAVNNNKVKKQHLKVIKRMQEERQRKLDALEKENLEREVDMKRKELMNSTLLISKKNELLLELKNELNRIKETSTNTYRVKSLISKTKMAIENAEDWKVFETNFNELHDDFFKKLIHDHPQLSTKDLKLCAYLKMNLTSKEISPLMAISVRGVELHRYRLRKKLDLEKGENLTNYLLSL
ncbi:Two component regulator three Y domain-containing protein [Zhouia sp. PK063]|uniref:Two component regulator three Y domain-containing protein n=1 Tax=Zhouia sp. PK063 TaxID=3373602 RepID=UPI003792EC48